MNITFKRDIQKLILALLFILLGNDLSAFQSNIEIHGSARVRAESKVDYNFKNSSQDYLLSQFRLNINWKTTSWLSLFVEGQDARVFGESIDGAPKINSQAIPNIYEDQFDIHRAFAKFELPFGDKNVQLKAGRQKFNLGAKRLVSSLEWVNTARVWDGVKITFGDSNKRIADIFISRLVPVKPNKLNNHDRTTSRYFNSSFSGAYITDKTLIPNVQTEYYLLYRSEDNVDDAVSTVGVRLEHKKSVIDINSEIAIQVGKYNGLDHFAQMFHFEVGYTSDLWSTPRISTAYNFGSGDDDPKDDKHKTFDNLYPLNHAYYGYMDLFGLQNLHNFELIGAGKINNKLSYRIGVQSFFLVQKESDSWYNAGLKALRTPDSEVASSHVGNEIDVTFTFKIMPKWTLIGGASTFFKGDYINETGNSEVNPNFYFLMTKYSF